MFNFNSKKEWLESFSDKGTSLLYKKISSDILTPVLAFLKINRQFKDHLFLFESAENDQKKGRFSVIGLDPDLVWRCKDQNCFINRNFQNNSQDFIKENSSPLQSLRQVINQSQIDFGKLQYYEKQLPGICAGLFGYMGYDMVRLMENLPNNNLQDELLIPDSIFIRPQILLVFDSFYDSLLICAPCYDKTQDYQSLKQKILEIEEIILGDYFSKKTLDDKKSNFLGFDFKASYTAQEYQDMVIKAKEYITAGDVFQVLPSQRFVSKFPNIDQFEFYRSLRSLNPSPFLFYLKFSEFVLVGSSPEIMVAKQGDKVIVRPLAGTRLRGKNSQQDKEIANELLNDQKEVAEHLMLIDLARNDIGMVAKAGSIEVTKKMIIEYYSHVMHISSSVEGQIADNYQALDALISAFPAGTVSGAPKIRAMEIIEELEKLKRGFYSGCVGYFSGNGDMETCITLRSALIKDEKIYLHSGAGVVFDSDPKSEYQETLNKAKALVKACEALEKMDRK